MTDMTGLTVDAWEKRYQQGVIFSNDCSFVKILLRTSNVRTKHGKVQSIDQIMLDLDGS